MKIKYKVMKIKLTNWETETGKVWRYKKLGYAFKGKFLTKAQLEKKFTNEEILLMKRRQHKKFLLEEYSPEIDEILKAIQIKKWSRIHKTKTTIKGKELLVYFESNKKYGKQVVMSYDGVTAKWGITGMHVRYILIDKLKRKYNYKNPYIL